MVLYAHKVLYIIILLQYMLHCFYSLVSWHTCTVVYRSNLCLVYHVITKSVSCMIIHSLLHILIFQFFKNIFHTKCYCLLLWGGIYAVIYRIIVIMINYIIHTCNRPKHLSVTVNSKPSYKTSSLF